METFSGFITVREAFLIRTEALKTPKPNVGKAIVRLYLNLTVCSFSAPRPKFLALPFHNISVLLDFSLRQSWPLLLKRFLTFEFILDYVALRASSLRPLYQHLVFDPLLGLNDEF